MTAVDEDHEMTPLTPKPSWIEANLGKVGIAFTIAYLLWGMYLYVSHASDFHNLKLNELGDFLAGYFGPLALGWLVLGFFQQRSELSQNTEALKLQHAELRQSVEQQKILARTTESSNNEEKMRTKVARQPIFHPELKLVSGRGDNSAVNEIEITNIGAPIHGVRAIYSKNIEVVSDGLQASSSSTWITSGCRTIRIALKKPTEVGRLNLIYRDSTHENGKQTLEFRPKANPMGSINSIEVLSPESSAIDIEDVWSGITNKS